MFRGGGTVELVSVASAGDLIVISCAPGWTEQDWDAAVTAAGVTTDAYLDAEEIESDGTEIFYLTTTARQVSVA